MPRRIIRYRRRARKFSLFRFTLVVTVFAAGLIVGAQVVRNLFILVGKATIASNKTSAIAPGQKSPNTTSPGRAFISTSPEIFQLIYNVTTPPHLTESQDLQNIVDRVVKLAAEKKFSTDPLSVTLIDINRNEIASYQQNKKRYPASVIKIFWMVVFYAQVDKGIIANKINFDSYVQAMIKKSSNDASSVLLDYLTGTRTWSKSQLPDKEFKQWLDRRKTINTFFQRAGYQEININQKTFPIPYLKIDSPEGTDLRMRGNNPEKPIRNQVTTYHAARLLYEMAKGEAVSQQASQEMLQLLTRDVRKEVWKAQPQNSIEFNPVESFFGESLPSNTRLMSKAGWFSGARNEAAFIQTEDGKVAYILVVFADDKLYAEDRDIFPEISRLVYKQMTIR